MGQTKSSAWHLRVAGFFFDPQVAFFFFILFLIGALVGLDVGGAFDKKFMAFGPAKDPADQAVFLQMRLDTWSKVLIVYAIAFLSSLLRNYYGTVVQYFIHDYAWNPLIKTINYSKFWTHVIIQVEPLLLVVLDMINFFVLFTVQLQFIIIQFLGACVIQIPYAIYRLSDKQFTSP